MYQFDIPQARIGTGSIRWDRYKSKFGTDRELIPLWIADTDFRAPEEVIAAIQARADHGVFGYTFATEDYLSAVAGWYQRRHGLAVPLEWISPTYGVVTALRFTIEALTRPGDQVLLLTPAYEPFFEIIRNTGRIGVEQGLVRQGGTYQIDFEQMELAFQRGIKLMIFCNPHNPVGRVWTREELEQVASLCARYGVYLASDEIHGDIELFGHRYTSMACLDTARDLTAVYTSAGKTFGLTGLCASNMIIPHEPLRTRIADHIREAWIMSPNLFGLTATQAAYEHGDAWLDAELAYLEGNSRYVSEFLQERMPSVGVTRHEGTFLMWLDFQAFGFSDKELERRMVEVCGLGLGVGSHYGTQYGQFMRLNIGCARSVLEQALNAMTHLAL